MIKKPPGAKNGEVYFILNKCMNFHRFWLNDTLLINYLKPILSMTLHDQRDPIGYFLRVSLYLKGQNFIFTIEVFCKKSF